VINQFTAESDFMTQARLFLFDIDCTLLWTRGAGREAMRHAMQEIFGMNDGINGHDFGGKTDWLSLVEMLGAHGYTYDDIAAIMPTYDAAMGKHLARIIGDFDVAPCPHAHDLIAELHAHSDAHLALVTGNVSSTAPIKMRAGGFDMAHFPVGAFGSEAMERDHLPPLALARANAHYRMSFTPEQVIVVGDTPADVACARVLGARVVAVRTGFCKAGELEASQPDYLIDDLSAFKALGLYE
jgi:phosphoglycolate phosphatase